MFLDTWAVWTRSGDELPILATWMIDGRIVGVMSSESAAAERELLNLKTYR